jgi:glutaredoxin
MKTLFLLFMVMLCLAGNSQIKPITITQKQSGNEIVLVATNNTTIEYEFELSITSSGLKVNKSLPLLGHLNPGEVKEVLTLTGIPGKKASFKYKLRPVPADEIEEEVVEESQKNKGLKVVVANSAKHQEMKARQNVEKHLEPQIVTVFTKPDCDICEELMKVFRDRNIPFQERNISHSLTNNELMWDALYVYGRKEGKVSLPVMVFQNKVFFQLTELLKLKDQVIKK